MMKLRRGDGVVLGFTFLNLLALLMGRVLLVRGVDVGQPKMTLYFFFGRSHRAMRASLRAAGYDVGDD